MLTHIDGTQCSGNGCNKKIHNILTISDRTLGRITNLSRLLFTIVEPMDKNDESQVYTRKGLQLACLMLDTSRALIENASSHRPMTEDSYNIIMRTFLDSLNNIYPDWM